jgi:hypothetical protein
MANANISLDIPWPKRLQLRISQQFIGSAGLIGPALKLKSELRFAGKLVEAAAAFRVKYTCQEVARNGARFQSEVIP